MGWECAQSRLTSRLSMAAAANAGDPAQQRIRKVDKPHSSQSRRQRLELPRESPLGEQLRMLPTMVIFSKACTSAICRALILTCSSVYAANPPRHDDARAAQVVCRCCSQAAAAGRSCSWLGCGAASSAAQHWHTINERPARPAAAIPARHAVCKRAARNCTSHGAQHPTAQRCCSLQA